MTNTVHRILTAAAATLLLSGVGALLVTEPASAAVASPTVAVPAAANPVGVPGHIPTNVCGQTVNGSGLNPAFGNTCVDD
jgi:hypothetical protein